DLDLRRDHGDRGDPRVRTAGGGHQPDASAGELGGERGAATKGRGAAGSKPPNRHEVVALCGEPRHLPDAHADARRVDAGELTWPPAGAWARRRAATDEHVAR